jgi:transposase
MLLGLYMQQVELIDEQISALEREISAALRPHQATIDRLADLPGLGVHSAQQVIAELGPDTATFHSAGPAASWVGVCPGREESAGQSHNNRPPKGNRPLRRLLNQLAWAAFSTKGGYFQDLFRRLVVRKGAKVAICAVAHRMLHVIWKVLHQEVR